MLIHKHTIENNSDLNEKEPGYIVIEEEEEL